jgi:predicted secreted hydrolase
MRHFLLGLILILFGNIAYASLPYYSLSFPRDEGAHFKNVPYAFNKLIEWWYFNGILKTDDGRSFSYDVAMFNPAFSYGFSGEYPYNSGKFSTDKLDIKLGNDFLLRKNSKNGKDVYTLKANGSEGGTSLKLNLNLEAASPVFLINENGLMPMMNNTNSYYYSIPHFKTSGSIQVNDATYNITRTPGDSWMDHQWGDFNLQQHGWEWFSVRLQNGLVANLFLIVEYKNKNVVGGVANIILPNGEKHFISYKDFSITRDDLWLDPKLGIEYPLTFNFNFPALGLSLKNTAAFPEQELNGYWEGYSQVSAVYNKQNASGYSYTEIVYQQPNSRFGMMH